MEIEPESEAAGGHWKLEGELFLYCVYGDKLAGCVPMIILIQMTKKLVKNNFLTKFGHKEQI